MCISDRGLIQSPPQYEKFKIQFSIIKNIKQTSRLIIVNLLDRESFCWHPLNSTNVNTFIETSWKWEGSSNPAVNEQTWTLQNLFAAKYTVCESADEVMSSTDAEIRLCDIRLTVIGSTQVFADH